MSALMRSRVAGGCGTVCTGRLRFGLRPLYEFRLDVDYDAVPIARASSEAGVQTVHRALAEIDQRTQGGHP
jgi:hypothetical protein